MRSVKVLLGAFVLLFFVFFFTQSPRVEAKPEYAKKEKVACTVCHIKLGKPELNDVGTCYKESGNLAACVKK